MKFGAVAPKDAVGATAVHTIRQGALVLKKGTLIGPVEAAALEAAGIKDIVVARLEAGDVSEDVAAAEIAEKISGDGVHVDRAFTGRANLFANKAGVLVIDKAAKQLLSLSIATYLDDPKDAVNVTVTFGQIPNGPNHVSAETINGESKHLTIAIQNDQYQRLQ